MTYPTVRIEGSIFTGDILDKIATQPIKEQPIKGQAPADFNLDRGKTVKDEIAIAWADAQDQWRIFQNRLKRLDEADTAVKDTRNHWVIPLLDFLGYEIRYTAAARVVDGRKYPISHTAVNADQFPIMINGYVQSLDRKLVNTGDPNTLRMSPHAVVQEYLNLTEHLYAIVTNGMVLRILRDSSRLVKLSFLEFDLRAMMEQEHFADFALLYRLVHVTRMPARMDRGPESLIEAYHQDSLESGARIRKGLSGAVESAIGSLGNGFLQHPDNRSLVRRIQKKDIDAPTFYLWLLRLIYRMLFLMVIEERRLIFPPRAPQSEKTIYYDYYSVSRLRKRSERADFRGDTHHDLWIGLCHTFRLFQSGESGRQLGISPLAGQLFGSGAIGELESCRLSNAVLLEAIRGLSVFGNPATGQTLRVNYGALNVEEFGSVYEGLLEFEPRVTGPGESVRFHFHKGMERSTSGSHYTPDELVQPLIRHSLDHVIEKKLEDADRLCGSSRGLSPVEERERALLSITVCDVACGSGHILLNAARRIGTRLARERTGDEQPLPEDLRKGIRDAINHCIYGVDKNPLAVELCKVALWLEAHNPGEPLNFLDHRIKCGDAIVGLARQEELNERIPDEAFKVPTSDDKGVALAYRKQNKKEREGDLAQLNFHELVQDPMLDFARRYQAFTHMPEDTVRDIETKKAAYLELKDSRLWQRLKRLADIKTAQFFIPKTEEYQNALVTAGVFRKYLEGQSLPEYLDQYPIYRGESGHRFFHWFLEFPDVFENGGFDCILGNPPFLGSKFISGAYGNSYLNYLKCGYSPADGQTDLVAYFLRRIHEISGNGRFISIITTNTIAEGATRNASLLQILEQGSSIIFAIRSIKWPGKATLEVSLLSIYKGIWQSNRSLNNRDVDLISSNLTCEVEAKPPLKLSKNQNLLFRGAFYLGDGFLLTEEEKNELLSKSKKNEDVIFSVLNGIAVNDRFDQQSDKYIINFFDWSQDKALKYEAPYSIVKEKVKPIRDESKRDTYKQKWWIYAEHRPGLFKAICNLKKCFIITCTTKYLNYSASPVDRVFTHSLFVYATEKYSNYSLVQSTIHNEWARKYSSTLETRLRYAPSDCFETFPFPQNLSSDMEAELEKIGEQYHEFRRQLMLKMQLGLTKTYNQFHNRDLPEHLDQTGLTPKEMGKTYGKETVNLHNHLTKTADTCSFAEAASGIFRLRRLHKEMDQTVLRAYGWTDIDLAHDFYDVDYLPENDRVRYTISPDSRKEILRRLLELNHRIHQQEKKEPPKPKQTKTNKKPKQDPVQRSLFD